MGSTGFSQGFFGMRPDLLDLFELVEGVKTAGVATRAPVAAVVEAGGKEEAPGEAVAVRAVGNADESRENRAA